MMQNDPYEETQILVTASHADASDGYVYIFGVTNNSEDKLQACYAL